MVVFFGCTRHFPPNAEAGFAKLSEGVRTQLKCKVAMIEEGTRTAGDWFSILDLIISHDGVTAETAGREQPDFEFVSQYRGLLPLDRAIMRIHKEFDNPELVYMLHPRMVSPPTDYVHFSHAFDTSDMDDPAKISSLLARLLQDKNRETEDDGVVLVGEEN